MEGKQVSTSYATACPPAKQSFTLPFSWETIADKYFEFRSPKSKTWVDVDPVELEAYNKWYLRYEALQSEGVANGWLYQGYEGDEPNPPAGKWVYEYDD